MRTEKTGWPKTSLPRGATTIRTHPDALPEPVLCSSRAQGSCWPPRLQVLELADLSDQAAAQDHAAREVQQQQQTLHRDVYAAGAQDST